MFVLAAALAIVAIAGLVSAGGGAATASGPSLSVTPSTSAPGKLALEKRFAAKRPGRVTVRHSYNNDVSRPLRLMRPLAFRPSREREASPNPKTGRYHRNAPDRVVQTRMKTSAPRMPSTILNVNGIAFPGVNCSCFPPDTNGEVGLSQYVEMVNQGIQVFDKATGASVYGPVDIATLWNGFGGVCDPNNADAWGDPIVVYDQLANRWVISQFAGYDTFGTMTDECIAVSRTSDATGSYNRYDFHLGANFYDYPKIGVWPDGYYMSMNVFNAAGNTYLGPQPFAFNRTAMLHGLPGTFITTGITNGNTEDPYLPADLDGATPPPNGAPAPFVEWPGNGTYKVYRFHADWVTPANSTFALAGSPAAAPFTQLCGTTPNCVPQLGTTAGLDLLGDRLMFRAAYRNFGDHESLVSNYTVGVSNVAALRWFELNHLTSGSPTVVQQSTFNNGGDGVWRWMGSTAEDRLGDMALGYSASSSALHPQIRYVGRVAADPVNTLGQAEAHIFDGAGSQTNASYYRWGDYSDMTVDPVDDCTFWYAQEYYAAVANVDWRTRIANFKYPGCSGPNLPDVTISKTPDGPSVAPGDQIGFTVELANEGDADATGLSFTDLLPTGTGVSWSVDGAGSDAGWSVSGSPPNQSLVYTPTTLAHASATHVHVVSSTTPNSCGIYDNTASFTANGGLSGSDSASTAVSCVTITKAADNPSRTAGQQIGFTVQLANISSTLDATGLALTDPLPAGPGMSWTIQSGAGWSITGTPPNQSLVAPSSLTHGTSTQVHIVSNTAAQSCGDYFNDASFTTANAGDGEASADVVVNGCADLAIFKAADVNLVAAGSPIGFGVEVDNFGDGDGTGLAVTDHLPGGPGVTWSVDALNSDAGWSITGSPPNQNLVYSPTTLTAGNFSFVHIVSSTGLSSCTRYNNTAQFSSANGGSDSASDSLDVVGCSAPPPAFRTLNVFKGGAGAGTVTSSPSGLTCGPVCTAQFSNGTSVTLTEAPSSSSKFGGWSGDCSGTASTCVLSMTADHSVTAIFAKKPKCKVPKVVGLKLAKAKAKIRGAHCGVGKIKKKFSSRKKKGRVLGQKPKPGKTLTGGSKVNLTVGKGPKH
jgi:uncharacterized repeat protein (TIGR01451 family)